MPWTTFAIPALMATVGAGALVTGQVVHDHRAGAGESRVWIDGPSGGSALPPGKIPVTAHATADDTITGLDLYVDGKKVTNDKTLVRNEKLFYGGFTWDADVGTHKLVVQQVGGTGEKSFIRVIVISEDAPAVPETTTPSDTTPTDPAKTTTTPTDPAETTTTPTDPAETTTTPTDPAETTTAPTDPAETTTTRAPGDTTPTTRNTQPSPVTTSTIAPPEGNDTVPGTTPSQTTEPIPDGPVIEDTTLVGTSGNLLAISYCDYKVTVTAKVRNADYVQLIVAGTGFDVAMTRNGDSYSLRLASDPNLWDIGDVGTHEVTVLAGSGDRVVDRNAGTVDIRQSCPKD